MPLRSTLLILAVSLLAPAAIPAPAGSQEGPPVASAQSAVLDPGSSFLRLLRWRRIGPNLRFETLEADRAFPYTIYAVPAAGPAVAIPGAGSQEGLTLPVGRDGGRLLSRPGDREVVFGSGPGGELIRLDLVTGERQVVSVWPDPSLGRPPEELPYRFGPGFPVFFSPHDGEILYAGGNQLFMTTDQGAAWIAISPELASEAVLTAALESPHAPGIFWTGSTDGTVALSRDFGETWSEVTPAQLGATRSVHALVPHPTQSRSLYLLASGDGPSLFRTENFGTTWSPVGNGGRGLAEVRSFVADPEAPGLLFAGTDSGVLVSLNDGRRWRALGTSSEGVAEGGPAGPVTALLIRGADLLVTGGDGGVWVLEDLSPLREMGSGLAVDGFHLFSPAPAYRTLTAGTRGLFLHYYLDPDLSPAAQPGAAEAAAEQGVPVTLEILEPDGRLLQRFSSEAGAASGPNPLRRPPRGPLATEPGVHRFVWDLRYSGAPGFGPGPLAVPGTYLVRLTAGGRSKTAQAVLRGDPRAPGVPEALAAQRDMLLELRDLAELLQEARAAVSDRETPAFTALEQARLGDRLRALGNAVALGQNRPTRQAVAVRDRLVAELGAKLAELAPFLNPIFLTDRQTELAALLASSPPETEPVSEEATSAPFPSPGPESF